MKKASIAVMCLFFFCSCARPDFSGSDIKAVKLREEAAAGVLDLAAPDGCSYNTYKGVYNCDEGVASDKINKRVSSARESIIEYLIKNPHVTNTDKLGFIMQEDLYYCRDVNGMILKEQDMVMYCESQLPSWAKDVMNEEEEFSFHESRYNEMYKYLMIPY